jgi:hypothetical protein
LLRSFIYIPVKTRFLICPADFSPGLTSHFTE